MLVTVDPLKPAAEQAGLMNRWHPDIPAFATVKQGQMFRIGCHEWTGGQIKSESEQVERSRKSAESPKQEVYLLNARASFTCADSDDSDDVANVDLTRIHYLR